MIDSVSPKPVSREIASQEAVTPSRAYWNQRHVIADFLPLAEQLQNALDRRAAGVPDAELDPFWTLVGYFNAIRELAGAVALARQDILQRGGSVLYSYDLQTQSRDTLDVTGATYLNHYFNSFILIFLK